MNDFRTPGGEKTKQQLWIVLIESLGGRKKGGVSRFLESIILTMSTMSSIHLFLGCVFSSSGVGTALQAYDTSTFEPHYVTLGARRTQATSILPGFVFLSPTCLSATVCYHTPSRFAIS